MDYLDRNYQNFKSGLILIFQRATGAVSKSSSSSIAIPLDQEILDRLQTAAHGLKLSVSAAISCAAEELAREIAKGWRPKQVPPSGPAYLAFHASAEVKAMVEQAAAMSGIKMSELNRISVWAALYKMEGKKQVLWPFLFTDWHLNKVVSLYSA